MKRFPFFGAGGWLLAVACMPALSQPVFTVDELVARARAESPRLAVARSDTAAAEAGRLTAGAYPNPEMEIGPGRLRSRVGGSGGGSAAFAIAQPIDNPWLRAARLRLAEARVDGAQARVALLEHELGAEIRQRAVLVQQQRERVHAFEEDVRLAELILDRVRVRVRSGEAPRFDLVRAEAEVAVARKNLESGRLEQQRTLAQLRQVVSPFLPETFDVQLDPAPLTRALAAEQIDAMRAQAAQNPSLRVAERDSLAARERIELEQRSVWPQATVFVLQERDPTITLNRVGVQIAVPLWNRREGPIAEARAEAERARFALEQRRFEQQAEFEAALAAWRAANAQVQALDGGIIERARTTVEIAEAAYRLGERGILEFLDAQRQFRLVRNELITARAELKAARVELERLGGRP